VSIPSNLLQVETVEQLAGLMEMDHRSVHWLAYSLSDRQRYFEYRIPKKSGDYRTIHAPNTRLKEAQRALLPLLEDVYKPAESVHGFVRSRSIKTNVSDHVGKRYVLNVDLHDFFPSITSPRIQGLLTGKPYELT
jgi:RNA-directed DNA polymerase